MNTAEKSLRSLVDRWLTPTSATPVRVIQFGRTSSSRGRYVRVEAHRPDGPVALFFFRHNDGTWRVFPPDTARSQYLYWLGAV
ncbi:hypothetical protein GCT13_24820 [Paraburkholderia sp. CNPSo 3157]|uniref:Uncharacterized protein n=1 Tax=Paraburkholderia franconis TaxID=2654983 RepID=A0A7X1NEF5_9BURK|nr:hypothetical protein [Paraburkholderia franconis]